MKNVDLRAVLASFPDDVEVFVGKLLITGAEAAYDFSAGEHIEVVSAKVADPDPDEDASPAILLTTSAKRKTSRLVMPGQKLMHPGLEEEMQEIDPDRLIGFTKR